jgi:hypothetical protein
MVESGEGNARHGLVVAAVKKIPRRAEALLRMTPKKYLRMSGPEALLRKTFSSLINGGC